MMPVMLSTAVVPWAAASVTLSVDTLNAVAPCRSLFSTAVATGCASGVDTTSSTAVGPYCAPTITVTVALAHSGAGWLLSHTWYWNEKGPE